MFFATPAQAPKFPCNIPALQNNGSQRMLYLTACQSIQFQTVKVVYLACFHKIQTQRTRPYGYGDVR